jgi:hypothetical protein
MDVVFATETASLTSPDGSSVLVRKGTHWSADDPLVRAYPGVFAADPRYGLSWTGPPPPEMSEPPVEQATAAPGEKRNVRRG